MPDNQFDLQTAERTRTLFLLDARIAAARAELASLTGNDADGERRSVSRHDAQLVHENERLAIAANAAKGLQGHAEEIHRRQVTFLAMVAHELRNPLNPILTAAALLDHATANPVLLEQVQDMLRRQVRHLTRLVDDLLDGARVSTGKFRLECKTVSLGEIIETVVASLHPTLMARQQTLAVGLPPGAVMVCADPDRMTQILCNLLDNASKYSTAGGAVGIHLCSDADTATIRVTDDGIGITPQALPYIFDLFMQETRARAHHGHGLGIGLAVVRELVEAHGGTITATSAGRGLGSQFTLVLPRAAISMAPESE